MNRATPVDTSKDDEKELAAMGLAPVAPAAAPTPAPVIEVASEKVATPAPTPKPEPTPTPAPAPAAAAPVEGELLPDAMVTQLEDAIGEHGPKAVSWMLKEGWLKPGETLANLTKARANKILVGKSRFIAAINRPF